MKNYSSLIHITMKDVAMQAGVSIATVSRTLTNPEKVSIRTRSKVKAAANAIGYDHGSHLRLTPEHAFRKIFVLVADISDLFYSKIINSLEKHAKQHRCILYFINISQCRINDQQYIERLLSAYHDGTLYLGLYPPQFEQKSQVPAVVVNEFSSTIHYPTVHIDNLTAAFNAVNHLIIKGYQHIACLTGPDDLVYCQYRRQGYLQALQRYSLLPTPHYIARGNFSFDSGRQALKYFMQLPQPPDAIFCHNDQMAMGVLFEAKQRGIAVPEQLGVVGFDDLEESHFCSPPLTTVTQPREKMGEIALLLLLDLVNGKNLMPNCYQLEAKLNLRQSTR